MKPHSWLIQRRSTLASPPWGVGGAEKTEGWVEGWVEGRRVGRGGKGSSKAGRSGAGDDELEGNLFSLCLYLVHSVDVTVRVYIQKRLMGRAGWRGEGGALLFSSWPVVCTSVRPCGLNPLSLRCCNVIFYVKETLKSSRRLCFALRKSGNNNWRQSIGIWKTECIEQIPQRVAGQGGKKKATP